MIPDVLMWPAQYAMARSQVYTVVPVAVSAWHDVVRSGSNEHKRKVK